MSVWLIPLVAFAALAYKGRQMWRTRGGFGEAWAAIGVRTIGVVGMLAAAIAWAVLG